MTRLRDNRIVKYNMDFCFREFKYEIGAVRIDLEDVNNMHGHIIASWGATYAQKHLKQVLTDATGIGAGWTFEYVTAKTSKQNDGVFIYDVAISSRLYKNLRKLYERTERI